MKRRNRVRRHKDQKGSALLVSLMVMVALSLLGLGFVAVSETESAISVNQRNYTQTQAVAELGARMAVEWLQNAEWAERRGLLPPNDVSIKTQRQVAVGVGSPPPLYVGYYKETVNTRLCDLPFKPDPDNRLYGDENSADVIINASKGSVATTFLDRFNAIVLQGTDSGGRITDIRLYAPPIVGGTLTERPSASGKKFWDGGTRYGVATIRVTATKTDQNGNFVAERTVKVVVADFPFPGPEGPLQSNTGISTNGAFRVHWGKVTSEGDLYVKRPLVSIPWRTAWQQAHFEYGTEPPALCVNPDDCQFKADPTNADYDKKYNWLFELTSGKDAATNAAFTKDFEDPWFQARARVDITSDSGNITNQPYPYSAIANPVTYPGIAGWSNQFQNQDTNDESINKKEVLFPKIDYVFWKQIAMSGMAAGTDGIYYLQWANNDNYTKNAKTKTVRQWTDTLAGAKAGFYFFDTATGVNPQRADGTTDTTVLADAFDYQGGSMHMRGFIYTNAKSIGTQGLGGRDYAYAMAGEPFRDVGYREVAEADAPAVAGVSPDWTKKYLEKLCGDLVADPGCTSIFTFRVIGALDGIFTYQDLPWSNKVTPEKKNGQLDVFIQEYTVTRDSDGASIKVFLPVPYTNNCEPGNNADCPTCNCSEPHEPYLNLIYPDTACATGSCDPKTLKVMWENPGGAITRRPRVFTDPETRKIPFTCAAASSLEDCTSNSYDKTGALVNLTNGGPVLDGVWYNEGDYDSTGNAAYYGSVLIKGTVQRAGTVDVFYDESLSRGDWQKRFPDLPRVLITAIETDR
jgi:hypothetical protein